MMKNLISTILLPIFIISFAGCNQPAKQENEDKTPVSKTVTIKGKISNRPEQHMIDPQESYPYMDYFDADNKQFVVYTKEKINCSGETTITGKTIEIKGSSKKPGSDEFYTEEQILVNSFECEKAVESSANFISNEYPTKIIYTNDLSQTEAMKADCLKRSGTFNTCGSPCAPEAEVCIEVCAYTCELTTQPEPLIPVSDVNTDDWLSYSNKELGFSIKYPSTLNKKEGEGSPVAFTVWGPTQQPETEFYDGINISFNKEIYEGTSSFEAFINSKLEMEKEIAESVSEPLPVMIGGKTAYRVDIVSLGIYSNYYIPLDASYYLLISASAPDPTGQGYALTINKMLESIVFDTAI
jgi:hypothetical protein